MMNFGKAILTKKNNQRLLALALPMILSNITIPLLGLVDTAVIGHLSHAYYLGGVAVGSTIITLIFWLLGFLRMSTTGLVAQAVGADDTAKQLRLLVQGGCLAIALGMIFITLQHPIFTFALSLTDASAQVQHYAEQYFSVRIWSAPFALCNLVLLGWLLGKQQPKAAMWQLIFANSVNIVLDLLFVVGLQWGVQGAAAASVLADISGLIVALKLVSKTLNQQFGLSLRDLTRYLNMHGTAQLMRLNRDIFLRSFCLQLAFAFMTFQGARLGDVTVAANAVLLNLLLLISYALDGIAYYAEVEVGNATGERNSEKLKQSVLLAWFWSAISALTFALLFAVFGPALINLLTGIEAVQHVAQQYLPWLIVLPLLAFSSYLFDGVYIGAAKGRTMRNSMVLATFGVFFPLWWLLQSFDNHALWAAMCGFMLARSASLGFHYLKYFAVEHNHLKP